MEAEIITIGTEILLGEIVDTNTRTLARALRDIGLDIYRTSTVGDNAHRIADSIRESMARASAVITTGGLGPTVDDATREGVAQACGVETEFEPELWDQIKARFASIGMKPTENNRRQAYIPAGALAIENPVGTAPAFIMETEQSCIVALPGVPAEMVYLLHQKVIPYLRTRLNLQGIIKSRIVRTAGLGESVLDKEIEDLEKLSNPTVGLSAHPGRVDIRITAKASSEPEADEMIWGIEATLQQRLGDKIYGTDEVTLEAVVANWLRDHGMKICTLEHGTSGALAASFAPFTDIYAGGLHQTEIGEIDQAQAQLTEFCRKHEVACGLALILLEIEQGYRLIMHLILDSERQTQDQGYTGKYVYAEARAVSFALERMRQMMLKLPS